MSVEELRLAVQGIRQGKVDPSAIFERAPDFSRNLRPGRRMSYRLAPSDYRFWSNPYAPVTAVIPEPIGVKDGGSTMRPIRLVVFCAVAVVTTLALSDRANAVSINIDFLSIRNIGVPPDTYGAAANQSGRWNQINEDATSPTALQDLGGGSTFVQIELSGGLSDGSGTSALSADDRALLADNFLAAGSSWTVAITGLTNGAYNVYVYAPTNGLVSTSAFSINGAVQVELSGSETNTTITEGTDYLVASTILTDGMIRTETESRLTESVSNQ